MPGGGSLSSWRPISTRNDPLPGLAFIFATVPYMPSPFRSQSHRFRSHLAPTWRWSEGVGSIVRCAQDRPSLGDERLEGGVLGQEVMLDLLRLHENRLGVLVRLLGALVGGRRLDVLPHDDDGEQHQLEER